MTARIIEGKPVAEAIRAEVAREAAALRERHGRPPGLGVILVGDDPASHSYVRSKRKSCEEAGLYSAERRYPANATPREIEDQIRAWNADPAIDGILVQMPLPAQFDPDAIVMRIDPEKDVDGFHPQNTGLLAQGRPAFVPCTPKGVQALLVRSGIETRGKLAVILGRSNLVGRPMAELLMQKGTGADATVCVCHSRSEQLADLCRQADILIAAIGRPWFVKADMVKPGAAVIDVGINRIEDAAAAKGYRLVGDVDFEAVKEVAGAITPVPGGVGLMTVAMLLANTLDSARRRLEGTPRR